MILFFKGIEATEDDDFGDFEGPEDDAPESVQAMGGPPNWVFPGISLTTLLDCIRFKI